LVEMVPNLKKATFQHADALSIYHRHRRLIES